jgi:hypothetical protein
VCDSTLDKGWQGLGWPTAGLQMYYGPWLLSESDRKPLDIYLEEGHHLVYVFRGHLGCCKESRWWEAGKGRRPLRWLLPKPRAENGGGTG